MTNADVARMLDEVADLIELKDESVFKVRAYRRAARAIEALPKDLDDYRKEGTLEKIPGVGEAIAGKIMEMLDTGELGLLKKLRSEVPPGMLDVLGIPEVGPKTARRLHQALGIENVEDLRRAAEQGRIRRLKGFGPLSERRILKGIDAVRRRTGRMPLGQAYPVAESICEYLERGGGLEKVSIAGSLRRMRETVGDLDIVVASEEASKVMDLFVAYPEVEEVLLRGPTKSSVRLSSGMQVDLRIVEPASYGAALLYFTGSKDHNVVLRTMAMGKGYKINEYGIFDKDTGEKLGGEREGQIYEMLGLAFIPPELREDRGEIEAAAENRLPELLEASQIRGDMHVHSTFSDGEATIERIAERCAAMGYEYVGITDHSRSLKVAGGLEVMELYESMAVCREVSHRIDRFRVLQGVESEIKEDGSLDYPDGVLGDLDFVVGGVHSRFNMSKKEMTDRLVAAMSNDYLTVLAHPTGRIIERREGYQVDMDILIETAREKGVMLELNSFPDRLDLNDIDCRKAKEGGALICMGTDAHSLEHLDFMRYGVATARRGWLEPKDVLNTLSLHELEKRLRL